MELSDLDSDLARTLKLQREEAMAEQIDAIGVTVSKLRDEAIAARKNSGIEEIWRRCEEAYIGIDDVNRSEFEGQAWAKPMTMDAPISSSSVSDSKARSTVFVKLTSRYVDAAAARVSDTLLPVDDKAFSFRPTTIPSLEEASHDGSPVAILPNGMPLPNPQAPQMPLTVADVAQAAIAKATEQAERAEKRVSDWHDECSYGGEVRKLIHDAARIGVCVFKGPTPVIKKARKVVDGAMVFETKINPASHWIDPWNFYPAPDCGEDIHRGSYVWEHDSMSAKQLQDLEGSPGYLVTQIKKVLKEGPGKCFVSGMGDNKAGKKFDVWHFTGRIARKDLIVIDAVGVSPEGDEDDQVDVVLTLANDSVIRATANPLDSGEFPYDVMPWKRRAGHWAGTGIAEDLFTPQRMINGATRRMNDNAGLASGVQIIMDRGAIYPADGSWEITPDKIWFKSDESGVADVRAAFNTFTVPSVQNELMNIIQYALRLAEEVAGLPMIAQGMTGPGSPSTYGATQIQNNNANSMMRRVAKLFDDCITTPQINRYYEWLLMDPNVPSDEKGDMQIVVQGSSALVERSIQDQTIQQLGQLAVPGNPYRLSPEKWVSEMLRSKFISPARVQYSDEEWQQVQQQMQQQPQQPMPQIEVAKIRAQADMQKAQMTTQADMQKTQMEIEAEREIAMLENQTMQTRIKVDTDRDVALVQSQHERNQHAHMAKMQELTLKRELAMLEYAQRNQMTLEDIKAKLAMKAMDINSTRELVSLNASAKHLPTPPVEPPGRAAPGKSYTQ